MEKWESVAERKIREAMEAGAFEHLPDRGKPIPLDRNPFEDPSLWMAHHLLQVNGFAPAWIEEGRDLENGVTRLRSDIKSALPPAVGELRARAAELNRRILTYNLKCPSARLHKRRLDVEAEIESAKGR